MPARIEELELLLQAPLPPERRRLVLEELESLKASQSSVGKVLELQRDRLKKRIADIEQGKEEGDVNELKKEVERLKDRLKTRGKRADKLKGSRPLIGTFISDLGQTISLSLEVVEVGEKDVYVSDLTIAKSGAGPGHGDDKVKAIKNALQGILASAQGYGRGYVSFYYDGKVETLGITSTLGNLLNEALENVSTILAVAAVAAAPFTEGASLVLMIPAGIAGAIPSAYRLAEHGEAGTLRLDFDTAMDIVNIAGSAVSFGRIAMAGRVARLANPSLKVVRVGQGWMIVGLGVHGLGVVLLTTGILRQISELNQQNLAESERTARLLIIIGNALVQAGLMVGDKLVGTGRERVRSSRGEAEGRAARPVEEARTGGFEGTAPAPSEPGHTAAGLGRGGGEKVPPTVGREALVRDVRSKESLFRRLAEEGVRRGPGACPATPSTTVTKGNPRFPISDVHEAYRIYDEAVTANGGRLEAAIFEDTSTGKFAVCVGDEISVKSPPGDTWSVKSPPGDTWEGVLHFHPNPENAKRFRLPAPADFVGPQRRYFATGESVREILEYDIPGVGRGRAEYGITKGEEKPFYVTTYLPDGSTSTVRFAHDGTYQDYWSGHKTYVEPGSPLHKAMLADIPGYLKNLERAATRGESGTTEPEQVSRPAESAEAKTVAGTSRKLTQRPAKEPPRPLMTAGGDLTPEGIAFLRKRFGRQYLKDQKRRFASLTDEEVRSLFANRGYLLEAVVTEEIRAYHRSLGSSPNRLLLDARRQTLASIADRLQIGNVAVDRAVLKLGVDEFVRQNMADIVAALDNNPDPKVRAEWRQFAYGQAEGGKKGRSSGFILGQVGDKMPDIVEVFLDRRLAIVTDVTQRPGSPIHNFKTLFYALVIERMTGFDVGSVDYRSLLRQQVVERSSFTQGAPDAVRISPGSPWILTRILARLDTLNPRASGIGDPHRRTKLAQVVSPDRWTNPLAVRGVRRSPTGDEAGSWSVDGGSH